MAPRYSNNDKMLRTKMNTAQGTDMAGLFVYSPIPESELDHAELLLQHFNVQQLDGLLSEQQCEFCSMDCQDSMCHFLLECPAFAHNRRLLFGEVSRSLSKYPGGPMCMQHFHLLSEDWKLRCFLGDLALPAELAFIQPFQGILRNTFRQHLVFFCKTRNSLLEGYNQTGLQLLLDFEDLDGSQPLQHVGHAHMHDDRYHYTKQKTGHQKTRGRRNPTNNKRPNTSWKVRPAPTESY
eukprot:Colp12_sorted_trinity150504_noHs@24726